MHVLLVVRNQMLLSTALGVWIFHTAVRAVSRQTGPNTRPYVAVRCHTISLKVPHQLLQLKTRLVKRECNTCGKLSKRLKDCTPCRMVSYCDRNCQQADWRRHKSMCGAYEEKSEGLKPMDDIKDACASCGKTSDTLKKCTGCRRVSYCDRNCQKAHRSVHKTACGSQSTLNMTKELSTQTSATVLQWTHVTDVCSLGQTNCRH